MNTYLLVFADSVGNSSSVSDWLNQIPHIKRWRYDMAHAIFFKSEQSAKQIYKEIKKKIPVGRFFITRVCDEDRQGFITTKTWNFIKE